MPETITIGGIRYLRCICCGEMPVQIRETEMCAPCTFGEADSLEDFPPIPADQEEHAHLTDEEFTAVTEAFVGRLRSEMGRAGCNDVFADEFGESVARKFRSDYAVLEAWEERLAREGGSDGR